MKRVLLFAALLCTSFYSFSQRLLSWTPEFPADNATLVITVDCTKGNQGLLNLDGGNSNNVYVHVGVNTNLSTGPSDWKYVKFNYNTADPLAKATPLGSNKYQYTITNIRSFFGVPAGETIKKVNVIFRNGAGTIKQVNSDVSDMYIPVYGASEFAVRLNLPVFEPRFIPWLEPITAGVGGTVPTTGVSSQAASLTLSYNGTSFATAAAATTVSGTAGINVSCDQKILLTGNNGTTTAKDSAVFFIPASTTVAALPAGVQDGINYSSNNTEATLVLYAPLHTSAVVIGDFSNWAVQCANQMNKTPDGNRYWIKLTGLTPATIYKFQYLVDGTIKTTDPYTELILDPTYDASISSATFPSMPAYPTGLTTGIVGTFQTAAPTYTWTSTGYTRPDKKNLVIYELLLRDFLATGNWQTLTDTLSYLKNLGVNAIEVMPFNEFEGNSSWGYNPDFFFAPDKAYGTKNNLKKFIDAAHGMGMAVIMDAVLNHATGLSPLAQLYWNSTTNAPAANSPYFNVTATHPFSVFNDFNHESEATKYHTARFIRHWLTEYKLDGFRWDLAKGFTQKNCGTDVNCWSAYDPTRIAIWKRYYDSSQVVSAGSYNILEFLGVDQEESELANYGMLSWGKMTDEYNQNTMGYSTGNDISRAYYKNRAGWTVPHLVTYAESHDEERIMYKNLAFGATNGTYTVKDLNTALRRTEAMMPFLLLIPGPKMIWEFGELGYDQSIFTCSNGTVPSPYGTDNCKLDQKPIHWEYQSVIARKRLYDITASLNRLRAAKPNAFQTTSIGGNIGLTLNKTLIINHIDLGLVVVGNFDLTAQNIAVMFPSAGTWYDYLNGGTFSATGAAQTISLQPGEYRVYTNQLIAGGTVVTALPTDPIATGNALSISVSPNPLKGSGTIQYSVPASGNVTVTVMNSLGQPLQVLFNGVRPKGSYKITTGNKLSALPAANYFIRIDQNGKSDFTQFIKN